MAIGDNVNIPYGKNATLTCRVRGITQTAKITWKNGERNDVTISNENKYYSVITGNYSSNTKQQISILTIRGEANVKSTSYVCVAMPAVDKAESVIKVLDLSVFSENPIRPT